MAKKKINIPEQDVISKYIGGESVLSLSHQYQTNTHRIQKILDDNDIAKVSQAKRFNPSLKEDYFLKIDSNEKAYWLGWLMTDGSVSKESHIEMALHKKDVYILELLSNDLGVTSHTVKPFNKTYVRFNLGSVVMCNHLAQYGIIPNKTHILQFPKINPQYEVALIRGMFEGDGGLTLGTATRFYKKRNKFYTKPYQEMSFTGTYDMCSGFQQVVRKYVNIPEKSISLNHSVYRVRWSNRSEIIQILDLLYKNCGKHYLKRKYDLYQKIKGVNN